MRRFGMMLIGALLALASGLTVAMAQAPQGPAPTGLQPEQRAFAEGLIARALVNERIAGAAVCIVTGPSTTPDGGLIPLESRSFTAGYGLARIDPQAAVDAQTTRFRIASISKTFTWLMLSRLIDDGRVGLDDPINTHLPEALKLPPSPFGEVLVRHLMTHTAGFEDRAVGHLFVDRPERITALNDYLLAHRPARVRPPGQVTSYSNYSTALAGALIAYVVGESFEDYAERTVFRPLGMLSTSYREPYDPSLVGSRDLPTPLPPQAADQIAQGLLWSGGRWQAQGFEYISQIAPAGSVSTTAADMCRYMDALLDPRGLERAGVLSAQAQARLFETTFTNDPQVNGFAMGFMQYRDSDFIGQGHGGATLNFHSNMALFPDRNIGVFITTNSPTGQTFARQFPTAYLTGLGFDDRLTPRANPQVLADWATDAKGYVGTYLTNRRSYTTEEKIAALTSGVVSVSLGEPGEILVASSGQVRRYLVMERNRFVSADPRNPGTLAFDRPDAGPARQLFPGHGTAALERIQFWQSPLFFGLALGLATVSSLIGLIAAFCRIGRALPANPLQRWAGRLMTLSGVGWLAFAGLALAVLIQFSGPTGETTALMAWPTLLGRALFWAATIAAGLSALVVLTIPIAVFGNGWAWHRRTRHVLTALIYAAAGVALWSWNLVGHGL